MGDQQDGKAEGRAPSSKEHELAGKEVPVAPPAPVRGTAAAQKGAEGAVEPGKREARTVTRRRGKIDRLPAKVQKEVNTLLLDPTVRYEDIRTFLKTEGYDVSTMSVCRYGRRFMEEVREMRVAEEQARALIGRAGGDAFLIEEAASRLFVEKILKHLMKPGFDITESSSLVSDFARLQSSSLRREKLKADLAEKAAEAVRQTEEPPGFSDYAEVEMQQRILGLMRERNEGLR